ncbi:MAG: glycosyltransferase family 2 protein [Bryobacteraceae bacterium]|jgi:glycosyltransferase involved in cell wall biosynthesis
MGGQVSVVIPVYNAAANLRLCLASLRASETAPLECIVVDDGSTDESAKVAGEYGAKMLSTGGRLGPASARNIGARAASGDILLFVDSDVCLHSDTIGKIVAEFDNDPSLDAMMGSYDSTPSVSAFLSQYRNLMHCYVHQSSPRKAGTFWAGCGAIRRAVFLDFGGFNEMYQAPAIEDIELGYRLAQANRNLILCPDIQVKHLKRWSLGNMLRTDFVYRALPWSELSLHSGRMPDALSLRISQRISVVLVFLVSMMAAYLAVHWHAYFLTPLFATFFILLSGYWVEGWCNRAPMVSWIMAGMLVLIAGLSWAVHMRAIIPLVVIAALGLFVRHRYAYSRETWRRRTGAWVGGYSLVAAGLVWIYFPWKPMAFLLLLLLLGLVWANQQFYLFLAAERGKFFALAAIPFHLLYFFSSGVAFLIVLVKLQFDRLFGSARRPAGFAGHRAGSTEEAKATATMR